MKGSPSSTPPLATRLLHLSLSLVLLYSLVDVGLLARLLGYSVEISSPLYHLLDVGGQPFKSDPVVTLGVFF